MENFKKFEIKGKKVCLDYNWKKLSLFLSFQYQWMIFLKGILHLFPLKWQDNTNSLTSQQNDKKFPSVKMKINQLSKYAIITIDLFN